MKSRTHRRDGSSSQINTEDFNSVSEWHEEKGKREAVELLSSLFAACERLEAKKNSFHRMEEQEVTPLIASFLSFSVSSREVHILKDVLSSFFKQ